MDAADASNFFLVWAIQNTLSEEDSEARDWLPSWMLLKPALGAKCYARILNLLLSVNTMS
jgi:hypothetical protein